MFRNAVRKALKGAKTIIVCIPLTVLLGGCYPLLFWHPVAPMQFKNLQARAEKGDTDAQLEVSQMLACGRSNCGFGPWRPKCDDSASMKWLRSAAEAGNPKAQHALGEVLNQNARSYPMTEKNSDAAIKWYQRSAAQGYVPAYMSMARIGEMGHDSTAAAGWYRKAAEAGDVDAQIRLAKAYAAGEGMPRDARQASHWAEKAGMNGKNKEEGISAVYGAMNPPDNAEAYYWAGLKSARLKMNLDGRASPLLDRAQEQDDVYLLRLAPAQAAVIDRRISTQIDADCKELLATRRKYAIRPDRSEATQQGPVHYCLERQKIGKE